MQDNSDLVGQTYLNDGVRYTVLRVCRQDPEFVAARSVSGQHSTALASFVRLAIEDEKGEPSVA